MARKRVDSSEREAVWRELLKGWRASGLTQEANSSNRPCSRGSYGRLQRSHQDQLLKRGIS